MTATSRGRSRSIQEAFDSRQILGGTLQIEQRSQFVENQFGIQPWSLSDDHALDMPGQARFTPANDGQRTNETETPALGVTESFDVDRGGENRVHGVAWRRNSAC